MTTHLFLERKFATAIEPADVLAMAAKAGGCYSLYRINWQVSMLSRDGSRMLCSLSAPDMESARMAMRQSEVDSTFLWRGTIHDAPDISEQDVLRANVLVERSFDEPVELKQIQAIEDAGVCCLESRQVRFVRSFFSIDRKRMICLYLAPDAESVRESQREAGVPFDEAWACQAIGPTDMTHANA